MIITQDPNKLYHLAQSAPWLEFLCAYLASLGVPDGVKDLKGMERCDYKFMSGMYITKYPVLSSRYSSAKDIVDMLYLANVLDDLKFDTENCPRMLATPNQDSLHLQGRPGELIRRALCQFLLETDERLVHDVLEGHCPSRYFARS